MHLVRACWLQHRHDSYESCYLQLYRAGSWCDQTGMSSFSSNLACEASLCWPESFESPSSVAKEATLCRAAEGLPSWPQI